MFLIPLQYALAVAVAITQIFGGVSCCCVGRAVLAALVGSSGVRSEQAEQIVVPEYEESRIAICPKCQARMARTLQPKAELPTNQENQCQVGEDDQCRCSKLAIKANVPKAPASFELDVQLFQNNFLLAANVRNKPRTSFCFEDVRVFYGRHSWQAIACVWQI